MEVFFYGSEVVFGAGEERDCEVAVGRVGEDTGYSCSLRDGLRDYFEG